MEGVQHAVKPLYRSIGAVGDLYALIGGVTKALEDAGLKDRSDEFVGRAILSSTYGEVLALSQDYVVFEDLPLD